MISTKAGIPQLNVKKLAVAILDNRKRAREPGYIVWDNGVPKRHGSPFPIWDNLPDPLTMSTPSPENEVHPWSERRLKRAAYVTHLRYKTLVEVNDLSTGWMTADQLLWHEERAAMRAKNTLIAHKEWHRKISSDKIEQYLPAYRTIEKQYQNHLATYKRLDKAFTILRSWIQRRRAARGSVVERSPTVNTNTTGEINTTNGALTSLIQQTAACSLAIAGTTVPIVRQAVSRVNTDHSCRSDMSLD